MRALMLIVMLASVAACSSTKETARYQFGVSADRPNAQATPAGDQATRTALDQKVRQICTLGYQTFKVATMSEENDHQIVDLDVRCDAYKPDFSLPTSFSNIF